MIFILSIENDACTNDVINWLRFYDKQFVRINPSNTASMAMNRISDDKQPMELKFEHLSHTVSLDEINSYWYRRGDIVFKPKAQIEDKATYYVDNYLFKEAKILEEYTYHLLEAKFHINKRIDNETNKLINLKTAADCGLRIPDTWMAITSNLEHISEEVPLITKGMYNSGFEIAGKFTVGAHTERISKEQVQTDFPSCLQQEIKKAFELRIFYLYGKMYTQAIFSQQSEQTSVDFRKYDKQKPNRSVPYTLPQEIEEKLHAFMLKSDLNCGSIDMIVTPENDFYFVEVNPIGQFQQVSVPGNYYLDKKIAELLIQADEQRKS